MRRPMHRFLVSFFFLISFKANAAAPDYSIHQEYTSTRAMGMGNAFSAVVDDHSALFYNPAALAFRDNGQVRLFLRAGISDNWMDFSDDVEAADGDDAKVAAAIEKRYGEHLYSRVPTIGAMWVRPRWGIAFIPADVSIDAAINRQLGPALGVNAYLDSTLAYGYARQLKEKWIPKRHKVALGATVKAIHRLYYNDVVSAATIANDEDNIFDEKKSAEGLTVDLDIGMMWVPYFKSKTFFGKYAKPTFSVVARNVADYGFPMQFEVVNDEDPAEPPKLERRFDFGSKFDLPKFWVFTPKFAVDVRDVGHRNWTWMKGLHAGTELYWKMFNWWKGHWSVGINQGYLTAGFGARLGWFQLDLATWGEEVGTSDTETESRRYILEMSFDI
jgi:hypothetical protein